MKKLTINNIEKLKGHIVYGTYVIEDVEVNDNTYEIKSVSNGFAPNRIWIVLKRHILENGKVSTNLFWRNAWDGSTLQSVHFVKLNEMRDMDVWLRIIEQIIHSFAK